MTQLVSVLNSAAVGLFGTILSTTFCDIKWTRHKNKIYVVTVLLMAVLQAILFSLFGQLAVRALYPLITHLPLSILLWYLSRQKLWSIISVLAAYLCCQLRRWLALFCVDIFSGGEYLQDILELVVTVPLLLLLIRFAAPAIRSMSRNPLPMQIQFGLIPVLGYLFDYLTRVYTDWLIRGVPAAVEFMPFVCSVAYLVFVLHSAQTLRRQTELEQIQTTLDFQVRQSARQIATMKHSQELTAAYRHDMRHHLQYLSSCMESGATEQALDYIHTLHEEITQQTVIQYCENTTANLVFSSFASRANDAGISMTVKAQLSDSLRISDNDLCVLLSNALENALNSCVKVKGSSPSAGIEVRAYEKENQLFLELKNSCDDNILFENDIPVTKEKGHGLGVRSIIAVVEKYNGIYVFEQQENHIILRLSI